jgi:uncharacterized protein (DUF1499 family)
MPSLRPRPRRRGGRLPVVVVVVALVLLLIAALLMALAGPAYRMGLLPLGDAFEVLRRGAYFAVGAAGVGLLGLVVATFCRRLRPALGGALVIAAVAAMMAVPWLHWQRAQGVPPIHDITTDTEDPPAFEALAEDREAAPNAVDYPGEDVARQQREAYADVRPLELDASLSSVREAVQAEVEARGWTIAEATDNRLEATATTRWFGFEDDVAIRLTEQDDAVRVDMRSASRLGRSDVGTNAARIRDFLAALEDRLD